MTTPAPADIPIVTQTAEPSRVMVVPADSRTADAPADTRTDINPT